jgi:hypothetical protein
MSTFGTDPHMLVRTHDPDTSHEAAHSVDTTRLEGLVYETISRFGPQGCISDEVRALYPNYPYSSITARYRALLDKGFIVDTGLRRNGVSGRSQRVLRVVTPEEKRNGLLTKNH